MARRTSSRATRPAPPAGRAGTAPPALRRIAAEVEACALCPRLRRYCSDIAASKRRAYLDWNYWGRPVPGFGDPHARLWVLGLAPAAHGGNRTGRVFTGDSSGDWLFRALHAHGFARLPTSESRHDGQRLRDCYISAAVRCAPPDNRPSTEERRRCSRWLEREIEALPRLRLLVPLGGIAFDAALRLVQSHGWRLPRPRPRFAHAARWVLEASSPGRRPLLILASYHPSRQNTQTGRLTRAMLDDVFAAARRLLQEPAAR
jgi:uracil-DNA glycosylase family 4